MNNLADISWKIENLKITIVYDKPVIKFFSEKMDQGSIIKSIFDILPEVVMRPPGKGLVEIADFNMENNEKLEMQCVANRLDFRVIFFGENYFKINGVEDKFREFIEKIFSKIDEIKTENILRVAIGIDLEREQGINETITFIPTVINVNNIDNEYQEIDIRVNRFSYIKNSEYDLRLNNILSIGQSQKIITEESGENFLITPTGQFKDMCTFDLDINTDPSNKNPIIDVNSIFECMVDNMFKILKEGL